MPDMVFCAPEVPAGFIECEVDGIKVYVNKYIAENTKHINLELKGALFFKYIDPVGVDLPIL